MSTKERIQNEIESLTPEELDQLDELIRQFLETRRRTKQTGVLTRLAEIQIEGPGDLAENHDAYFAGK